ncbi:MAG: SCP2 sterol-binding domain-containing protein [Aquificaceae bacterium]
MSASSQQKANSEDLIRNLRQIATNIQQKHSATLSKIKYPLLFEIKLPDGERVFFLISQNTIKQVEQDNSSVDRVEISYKDLIRLLEKPSRAPRYAFQGRLKIKGDFGKIMSTLKSLL